MKRLTKDKENKKIDGVCAGFANYFNIDATLVRLIWVLFTLLGGAGVLAYVICMLVMPDN